MPRRKKDEDYGPVTLDEIESKRDMLKDAEEALNICQDCGVECGETLTKISNLHKLLDMFHKIYKRNPPEGK